MTIYQVKPKASACPSSSADHTPDLNMFIDPLPEDKATGLVKDCYQKIRHSLDSPSLPVFFTYIGPFEEYLVYITDQLTVNLDEQSFKRNIGEIRLEIVGSIRKILKKPDSTQKWISLYKHSPSFYNFQKDLLLVSLINVKLACIFLALREAIKGWAVAAKKLPERTKFESGSPKVKFTREDFLFDYPLPDNVRNTHESSISLAPQNKSVVKRDTFGLEKNLLVEYLKYCRDDITGYMKKDYFWILRVRLEQTLLASLTLFPHLIYSPYNVIYKLTEKYENFYELLYLLYEQFPTLAVQRLILSAYMIIDN